VEPNRRGFSGNLLSRTDSLLESPRRQVPHQTQQAISGRSYEEGDVHVDEDNLVFQEFDPQRPGDFFLRVCFFRRIQQRVFGLLQQALPEITDPILLDSHSLSKTRNRRGVGSLIAEPEIRPENGPRFSRRTKQTPCLEMC